MSDNRTYDGVPGSGKNKCECADSLCSAHLGSSDCREYAVTCMYRTDMEDTTGTMMCDACASDAMDCGLFTDQIEDEDSEEVEAE